MHELINAMPTWLYIIFAIIALVVLVGWILLPLILMNTNAYLRRLLREQQRTNQLLEAMRPSRRADGSGTDVPSVRVEPRDR